MSTLAKYKNLKADIDNQIKRTADQFIREPLIEKSKLYGEFIRDLETEHRTGLKWEEVQE